MAEENPKLKKYEAAVKKLKAANEKAAEKLEKQKNKYQEALDKQKEAVAQEKDKVEKGIDKLKLQEQQAKDQLDNQKTKLNEDWEKKFEEAGLKKKPAEKKGSTAEVPNDYIPGGVEPWMATFADMVTLLMVFFVLFYSVEKDNTEKFKSAIDMMVEEDGPDGLAKIMKVVDSTKVMKNLKDMRDASQAAKTEDTIEKKVVLRVPGLNLFKAGGAKLQREARPVLNEIVSVINKKGKNYKIFIQGHTDDVPIKTPKFESNWELSAVRATAVLRYFYDKGIEPERLTATGYADTFPMVPNNTKEGRAKNRRIEFVLEKMPEKKSKKKKVDGRENMKPKKA
ncbi:MAG: OmpA family protein [Nitrospina sp.]|nr:OmpA family protein [Nitrospina sp.]